MRSVAVNSEKLFDCNMKDHVCVSVTKAGIKYMLLKFLSKSISIVKMFNLFVFPVKFFGVSICFCLPYTHVKDKNKHFE